jgi:hypothetical protein
MFYWFMDQEDRTFWQKQQLIEPEIRLYRLSQTRKRLNSLCKHLLEEVNNSFRPTRSDNDFGRPVDFLYRTVRDFFCQPAIAARLQAWKGGHSMLILPHAKV